MQTSRAPELAPSAPEQGRVLGGRLVVEEGLDGASSFLVSPRRRREAFGLVALARVEEPLRIHSKLPYIFDAQVVARRDGDVGPHA